jgi:hypothetical protein
MFMQWLMEQEDRDDSVGSLYKLIYNDRNNGCLNSVASMKYVIQHFINVHPNQFIILRSYLVDAIKAYEDPLAK